MHQEILLVFIFGLITALATGLGAIPFVFLRGTSPRAVAYANAIAAGLMLGASVGLVIEGSSYGTWSTRIGVILGVVFIELTHRYLDANPTLGVHELRSGDRRVVSILLAMTAHSFAEGIAVGVSFGGGFTLATLITLAIAVHNVPEGLAISAVLRSRGATLAACAGWSIFSSLPQPLMAVPAFVFVDTFRPLLPYGLGFAAGAMVYVALRELLPEAYESASPVVVSALVVASLAAMVLFQWML